MRRALAVLAELPLRRPYLVLLLSALSLIPAALWASRLEVRTSFSELLPETRPSVAELRRVSQRLAGTSTLIVAVEGRDAESLRRFVSALSPRIRALGPRYVAGVDDGARALREFVETHKLLYADVGEVRKLRETLSARYDYEVGRRTGFDLGLSDEDGPAAPPISVEELRTRVQRELSRATRELGGDYYLGENGRLAAIVVTTPFESGDPRAFELVRRIRELGAGLKPESWDPSLTVHFTGSLITSAEEHRAVTADLTQVGVVGVAMILIVVFLFFLRVRALLGMLVTIATGCLWTFAATYLGIGHLNSASGFLVSIVAGNGINFGIIVMARYLEERAAPGSTAVAAVRRAMYTTALPTAAVALTASVAYGSLAATDFRGFRHFGLIAAIGMALCWIATYSCLPAFLVAAEQVVPIRHDPKAWTSRLSGLYGRPFAYLARKMSGALLVAAVLGTLVCGFVAARWVAGDPMEYDLRNIRSDDSDPTSARQLARRVDGFVSRLRRDGHALLVDRLDQVEPLVQALEQRRRAAGPNSEPFERTVTAFDLLPRDQAEKIALWSEIGGLLERAHRHGVIADETWAAIQDELASGLHPLGLADLPADVVWPFVERDGTRGRIVYLVPARGQSLNDAHYLVRWAESFRHVPLPTGEVIRGTGSPVIVADVLESVRRDAPKALLLAVTGTCLIILLAFRGRRAGQVAVTSVVVGLVWLMAFLAVTGTRINFLNFVALPISIGVGADYAVNVMQRYEQESAADLAHVLVRTGGAVVLCSLTTLLGYAALLFSINGAVRSFGLAGVAGELSALLSAMLILPAYLTLTARQRSERNERAPIRRSSSPHLASSADG